VIQTDHASKEIQEVGEDESYILDVSTASARLRASTPLGTMHGLQTLLQLVDVSPADLPPRWSRFKTGRASSGAD